MASGFPVTKTRADVCKKSLACSYAKKIKSAFLARILVVTPGKLFCSCKTVGMPNFWADFKTGPIT